LVGKGWQSFNALAPSGWVSVLYLGIFCTFLAYIFYYDALQNLTSASVGAYLYIEPIATMFIAFLVLAEPITLPSLLGGTLIIIGISLVNKRSPAGRTTVEESADIIPME
jgi:drug/metabolite transporter (DMT)-like permease